MSIQPALGREINLFNGRGQREFSQFQAAFVAIVLPLGALQIYQEQETLFKRQIRVLGIASLFLKPFAEGSQA